jgi:hypothetical protein
MASFDQHLSQAKNNLLFLKEISDKSKFFDWQVTTCFYSAVHLINAHLAQCADLHYRTHKETKHAISPDNPLAPCKFTEEAHDNYVSLEKLSRRSRYLCNERNLSSEEDAKKSFLTDYKHVVKAIVRLNKVMTYFNSIHGTSFEPISISCPRIKAELPSTLVYFKAA